MGPVNWLAVAIAALVATALHLGWHRRVCPGRKSVGPVAVLAVMLVASVMLGHMYARIGADHLAVKPWLYWMQSGGLAIAFVIPALWLGASRAGMDRRAAALDCGFWLVGYLAMGTVFWVLG